MEDEVEVVFTARWKMPKRLAEPWIEHMNNIWEKEVNRGLMASTTSAFLSAPPGYQPEIILYEEHK